MVPGKETSSGYDMIEYHDIGFFETIWIVIKTFVILAIIVSAIVGGVVIYASLTGAPVACLTI